MTIRKFCGAALMAGVLAALPQAALAQTQAEQDNVMITRAGVQNNLGYLALSAPLTATTCQWNTLYIDLTQSWGQAAYSLVLTARASGRSLSRVVYTALASTGLCMVSLAEM